jgi:hypothetical protein
MVDRDDIIRMAREAGFADGVAEIMGLEGFARFAALVAAHERKAFMEIIKPYLIPVGNSRSGELACEWNVRTAKEKNT